jgi:hypothetical protein
MEIENTQAGFEFLWRQIEATRQLLAGQSKRFCVRNILRSWFPRGALPRPRGEEISFDDLVWNVCRIASPSGEILGWTELPPPGIDPRPARDVLRAITQVVLGIGNRQVNFRALDKAYSQAYTGTKIKIDHKKTPYGPSPQPLHKGGE